MEGTASIEIRNLLFATSEQQLRAAVLEPCLGAAGVVSLSYTPRSGKATVEVQSYAAAERAVAELRRVRACSYLGRGLRVELVEANHAGGVRLQDYVENDGAREWAFVDKTAPKTAEQKTANDNDLEKLFNRLPEGPMRESLWAETAHQAGLGLVLKEVYLAYGRSCELVCAGKAGQRRQVVLRSKEECTETHLAAFRPLFDGLADEQRRAGIPSTLHRISRSVHAVSRNVTAITARVGRTISGHVAPMLECIEPDALNNLTSLAQHGLLLIGPPNVGKTTVLRELARLLSAGDSTVVVVVDKSLEIAGTDRVPHPAIGNARVLTVGHGQQARVMLEAIENQA